MVVIRAKEFLSQMLNLVASNTSCIAIQENRKFMKELIFFAVVFNETELTFSKVRLNKEIILIHLKCWRNFTCINSFKFYNSAVKLCQLSRHTFSVTRIKHEVVD